MIKPVVSNAIIPLAVGALTVSLLLSGYAMFQYLIPAGGKPHWEIEPVHFMKAFPLILMITSAIFFLAGPVIYLLLRNVGIFTWWGATVAGGLTALLFALLFSPFSILVHPFYFLAGAGGGLVSYITRKCSTSSMRGT